MVRQIDTRTEFPTHVVDKHRSEYFPVRRHRNRARRNLTCPIESQFPLKWAIHVRMEEHQGFLEVEVCWRAANYRVTRRFARVFGHERSYFGRPKVREDGA